MKLKLEQIEYTSICQEAKKKYYIILLDLDIISQRRKQWQMHYVERKIDANMDQLQPPYTDLLILIVTLNNPKIPTLTVMSTSHQNHRVTGPLEYNLETSLLC